MPYQANKHSYNGQLLAESIRLPKG